MKRPSPRTVSSLAIVALALVLLAVGLPHPRAAAPFASATTDSVAAPMWSVHSDTLHAGETLSGVLERGGVRGSEMADILKAAPSLDARRIPAGMPIRVRQQAGDSLPSEIVFQLAVDRLLHVRRTSDSTWESTVEVLPWHTDTIVVGGVIRANLYQALDDSAATLLSADVRSELAWSLADVYEYRVDMSRELQSGDTFRALVERRTGPGGVVQLGNILAAQFTLSGSAMDAVRYVKPDGAAEYYDQTGRSMRASFLRAPLAFRRISSVFGVRKHPILGTWRAHKGTDYAANAGTPVRSIADGVVIFAGRKGGYGNAIDVRHPNGFVSRYGHLRGFARGIHAGAHVGIGQTIGYVGMTGLATGPHLHFEILVHGVQRNPSSVLSRTDGVPIPASERASFDSTKDVLLTALLAGEHDSPVASR
ncbi:MAG TPA: M23 family metallopeptidase [Gemmatimonadaceae bacterium]|nr:M23 family metallopeptidase [Gemmatimonadaceae bacterium]